MPQQFNASRNAAFADAVRRFFGMSTLGPLAVAPEWQPQFDPFARPDFARLYAERLGIGVRLDAAVGGQFSHVALRNPAPPTGQVSTLLTLVEYIDFLPSVANQIFRINLRPQNVLDATGTTEMRDSRWRLNPTGAIAQPQTLIGDITQAGSLGASHPAYQCNGLETFRLQLAEVLAPSSELLVCGEVVAQQVFCNIVFRERTALLSEITD